MKKKEHLVNMGVGDEARVSTSRTRLVNYEDYKGWDMGINDGIWGYRGIRGRIVEFVLLKGI